MKRIIILCITASVFLSGCVTVPVSDSIAAEETVIKTDSTEGQINETVEPETETEPVKLAEVSVAWNDKVPFGIGNPTALRWNEANLNSYEHPEFGRLIQPDKAGPEFFLFLNQAVFQDQGHIRGVQVDWYDGPDSKVEMTLDLTGLQPRVINAVLGDETGFQAFGRSTWAGDVVYQIFFDYNPSDYVLTYIEWEQNNDLFAVGEYKAP